MFEKMFKIDINLLKEQKWVEVDYTESKSSVFFKSIKEFVLADDVKIDGRVILDDNVGARFVSKLNTALLSECSRCLNKYNEFIETRIDVELDYRELEKNGVDIQQEILSTVLLVMPMKPLCKPSCRGLCISCGCNLNTERCKCSEKIKVDTRLEKLSELLKKMEKQNGKS